MIQRRNDAKVDVHGLELRHGLVADIQPQRTDGRLPGKVNGRFSLQTAGQLYPHQKTAGAGLHIALHTGHLSGKRNAGIAFQAVVPVKKPGRIQIGVAVHDAVAQEPGVLQGGDHGEYPLLLRPFQVGLEAHQIIDGAVGVVFAQLHHRVGIPACFGIRQALGLQGSEAQRVLAAAGHHLHRHTALKHIVILEAVDLRLLRGNQRLPEGQILLPVHGTVDVIRRALVIAAGKIGAGHIHTVKGHQRRGSVKEMEGIGIPQQYRQLVRQRVGGQGAGGDDHIALRDLGHFLRHHRDIGVAADGLRHHSGKTVAVHRQRTAGRHRRGVGAPQDQAVQPPQLLFQQAYGVFQTRAPQ